MEALIKKLIDNKTGNFNFSARTTDNGLIVNVTKNFPQSGQPNELRPMMAGGMQKEYVVVTEGKTSDEVVETINQLIQ